MPCARPHAHPGPQLVVGQHPAVRVARRVQPDQHDADGVVGRGVGAAHREPGQHRTDLVGRVRDLGDDHGAAAVQAEQGGQERDQLLGPDGRDDRRLGAQRVGDAHPEPALQPVGRGRPQVGGAEGGRVAGRVAGGRQRVGEDGGGVVDRRPDRQVDHPAGVLGGSRPRPGEGVPGEVGQLVRAPRRPGQCSSPCGGRAATSGWSLPIFPVLAAPPGLPRSEKNSTLAL